MTELNTQQFCEGAKQFYEKTLVKKANDFEELFKQAQTEEPKITSNKFGFLVAYGLAATVDILQAKYPEIFKEISKEVEEVLKK